MNTPVFVVALGKGLLIESWSIAKRCWFGIRKNEIWKGMIVWPPLVGQLALVWCAACVWNGVWEMIRPDDAFWGPDNPIFRRDWDGYALSHKGITTHVSWWHDFRDDALESDEWWPWCLEDLVWKLVGYTFPQKRNQWCDEVLSTWDIRPLLPCQMAWENLGGGGSRSRGTWRDYSPTCTS
jgi:hypothetical protein